MQVLIVDDIKIIRSGIISALQERYRDFVFLEAENGLDALAIESTYDLVITDIKMPQCDGLELIARLRERGFTKPILILSGFGEFEYAKKALDLGVNGYLLKPIENDNLYDLVDKALDVLVKNKSEAYLKQENELLNTHKQRTALTHALQNAVLFSSDISKCRELCGHSFCLAVIGIEKNFYESTVFLKSDLELLRYAINNIVEYLDLSLQFCLMEHPSESRQLLLLFYEKGSEDLQNSAYMAAQKIKYELFSTIHVSVSLGISDVQDAVDNRLYQHAVIALSQRTLYESSGVYLYTAIGDETLTISCADVQLIDSYIQRRCLVHLNEMLCARLLEYAKLIGVINAVNLIIPVIAQSLIKYYGFHVYEITEALSVNAVTVNAAHSIEELAREITNSIEQFFKANDVAPQKDDNIIAQVREYLDTHYKEDVSVKTLAAQFNINYSYLSSLFAKETGMGIAAYAINIRMEAAKNLLRDTSADISSIAEMAGYEDLQYFYRVFKKHTGQTPLAFRNNTKKVQ